MSARASAKRALRRLSGYVAVAVLSLVILLGAGVAVTQTSWFKNWLRQKAVSQAAQYLNGELTIKRLSGNIFTGVALEGVGLHHEGQTVVAMDRLIVQYSPLTMISQGVILDSITLENPTILLQRDDAGWNFNRFVKTRRNTGGRGAPPITMEAIAIDNGHLIVRDRDRLVEDLTRLNTRFRFAYEKPGVAFSIAEFSATGAETKVRSLAGDLRFDRGSIAVRNLAIRTDGSKLVTAVSYSGPKERLLEIDLDAERLSLPEIGRYFRPLANITLEPCGRCHRAWNTGRTLHEGRRRLICRLGRGAAGRTLRRRIEELGRASRRARRGHGANPQSQGMEDARHRSGRFRLAVQSR